MKNTLSQDIANLIQNRCESNKEFEQVLGVDSVQRNKIKNAERKMKLSEFLRACVYFLHKQNANPENDKSGAIEFFLDCLIIYHKDHHDIKNYWG